MATSLLGQRRLVISDGTTTGTRMRRSSAVGWPALCDFSLLFHVSTFIHLLFRPDAHAAFASLEHRRQLTSQELAAASLSTSQLAKKRGVHVVPTNTRSTIRIL